MSVRDDPSPETFVRRNKGLWTRRLAARREVLLGVRWVFLHPGLGRMLMGHAQRAGVRIWAVSTAREVISNKMSV